MTLPKVIPSRSGWRSAGTRPNSSVRRPAQRGRQDLAGEPGAEGEQRSEDGHRSPAWRAPRDSRLAGRSPRVTGA